MTAFQQEALQLIHLLYSSWKVLKFKAVFKGIALEKTPPGGVININTRRPGENHRSKLYASYGTFNSQNYRVLADGPTGENSSYYFGINRSETDGFADNANSLGNDATAESWNGRLGFNWISKEGLKIGLGGTWENFDLEPNRLCPDQMEAIPNIVAFITEIHLLRK